MARLRHYTPGVWVSEVIHLQAFPKIRNAAAALHRSLEDVTVEFELPMEKFTPVDDKLRATLEWLTTTAGKALKEIEKQHVADERQRGRPPLREFIELNRNLFSVYETLSKNKAKQPQWLVKSVYSGEFYNFVVVVWKFFLTYFPEVRDALPKSENALGSWLKEHWSEIKPANIFSFKLREVENPLPNR
jgi:hypothetical protein